MDQGLYKKIKTFLEKNFSELYQKLDMDVIVNELHPTLKEELFFYQYGELIKKLEFIQNISHSECKWAIVRSLKKIMFGKGDLIYNDNYISESIYFIETGQVRLYAENGFPFQIYKYGETFGDTDVFCELRRNGTA